MTENHAEPVSFVEGTWVLLFEKEDSPSTEDTLMSSDGVVVSVDENKVVVRRSAIELNTFSPRATDGEYVRIGLEGSLSPITVLRNHGDREGIWKVVFGLSD